MTQDGPGRGVETCHVRLMVGDVLNGRYHIERVLGQGGMGCVYLAYEPALDKHVAIKQMLIAVGDPMMRQQAVEQFQQEARLLAKLEHPNLVAAHHFFEENDHQYVVMAYIQGRTLEEVVNDYQGFMPLTRVLKIADELCSVLDYLHSRKPPVLFKDLKPPNVMVDVEGRIRLIDFGLARLLVPGTNTVTAIRGAGTHGFSPPEQFSGASTDPRSDIYALGATLYYTLTRSVPPSSIDLLNRDAEVQPLQALRHDAPAQLETALARMMHLKRDYRFQTAAEAREALKAVRPQELEGSLEPNLSLECPSCATSLVAVFTICPKCGDNLPTAPAGAPAPPPRPRPAAPADTPAAPSPPRIPPVLSTGQLPRPRKATMVPRPPDAAPTGVVPRGSVPTQVGPPPPTSRSRVVGLTLLALLALACSLYISYVLIWPRVEREARPPDVSPSPTVVEETPVVVVPSPEVTEVHASPTAEMPHVDVVRVNETADEVVLNIGGVEHAGIVGDTVAEFLILGITPERVLLEYNGVRTELIVPAPQTPSPSPD